MECASRRNGKRRAYMTKSCSILSWLSLKKTMQIVFVWRQQEQQSFILPTYFLFLPQHGVDNVHHIHDGDAAVIVAIWFLDEEALNILFQYIIHGRHHVGNIHFTIVIDIPLWVQFESHRVWIYDIPIHTVVIQPISGATLIFPDFITFCAIK